MTNEHARKLRLHAEVVELVRVTDACAREAPLLLRPAAEFWAWWARGLAHASMRSLERGSR